MNVLIFLLPFVIFVSCEALNSKNLIEILNAKVVNKIVNKTTNPPEVCSTKVCADEAAKVLSKLDSSIDPCDDFYEFACGKFLNTTVIYNNQSVVRPAYWAQIRLDKQLEEILKSPIEDGDIVPFQTVKQFYKACVNTEMIEKRGAEPIKELLSSIDWPVLHGDRWESFNWTWEAASFNVFKLGFSPNYLFNFAVETDELDSSKQILTLDRPNHIVRPAEVIKKILFSLFGVDSVLAHAEMDDVFKFATGMSKIASRTTKNYNPMNITTLQASFPFVDWLEYLNQYLPEDNPLTDEDIIVVRNVGFFKQLSVLLDFTGKRTLANYIGFRVFFDSLKIEPIVLEKLKSKTSIDDLQKISIRSHDCIESVSGWFPRALGALYIRKYFNRNSKAEAKEIINNIKLQFEKNLNAVTWMDDETKAAAKLKLEKMKYQIGYAEELLDDEKLTELSKTIDFNIDEENFFESTLNVLQGFTQRRFKDYREPVDKSNWLKFVTPITVNAYYYPGENTMKFPAGVLQGEFFNAQRPHYMNYGGIGSIMGHEMTHGFDTIGSQFDSDGNFKNWWANETKTAFLEKAQCIVDQYLTIVDPQTKLQLQGDNIKDENIADNGGFKIAYQAYVEWEKTHPEPVLPNVNFNPRQMFWISAAQSYCTVYQKQKLNDLIKTNEHSPSRFRVNVPFSNLKGFSKDFECPLGTLMNPRKKCEVW